MEDRDRRSRSYEIFVAWKDVLEEGKKQCSLGIIEFGTIKNSRLAHINIQRSASLALHRRVIQIDILRTRLRSRLKIGREPGDVVRGAARRSPYIRPQAPSISADIYISTCCFLYSIDLKFLANVYLLSCDRSARPSLGRAITSSQPLVPDQP